MTSSAIKNQKECPMYITEGKHNNHLCDYYVGGICIWDTIDGTDKYDDCHYELQPEELNGN